MPETNWGRKETIIWPPRKPIYTLCALFFAIIATGLFVYLRFTFGLTPLERYYLPLYLKTEVTGAVRAAGQYQLLFLSEVSYESVSQFSREYSRFFGQPPTRDIKALRDSNIAEIKVA